MMLNLGSDPKFNNILSISLILEMQHGDAHKNWIFILCLRRDSVPPLSRFSFFRHNHIIVLFPWDRDRALSLYNFIHAHNGSDAKNVFIHPYRVFCETGVEPRLYIFLFSGDHIGSALRLSIINSQFSINGFPLKFIPEKSGTGMTFLVCNDTLFCHSCP